ncbi:VCBS domain-containing protein [Pseudodesulfovibrio portus]|uniref:Cadherin domain-containing protein n=1 Tax=Pseudodesulfovibrio portus TaxID=231439 RepID=A0ABN6RUD4_9BACT|nr:Ig-like domain-containing protein [Pseudodesulfovibrio portus]BDQ33421.1 hypothetical protein JCM14722_09630 [Pseudodesulfovibrio portus]
MADPITQILQVSLPGAGQTGTYTLTADTPVKFAFDLSEAVFTGVNGNLEIAVEGGGTVILENYKALAESGVLPPFETLDGEQVAGDVYLFAFTETEETAEDLETAADGAAGGSGAGEYSDDPGSLFDGLDALGGQGDAFAPQAFDVAEEIDGLTLSAQAPVAGDDANQVDEAGDPDLYVNFDDPESHIRLSGGQGTERSASGGGEFFPLASMGGGEGGFVIDYPDAPQVDTIIDGNVILGDANGGVADDDPDGSRADLRMNTIDYTGVDFNGQNPGPTDVPDNGSQTVAGKYGTLVINSDGSYTYTLDQSLADELEEGETFDEVFQYNIVDPGGLVSNTATLTVTVHGFNDAPVAEADTSDTAMEDGDSDIPFETEGGGEFVFSEGPFAATGNVLANDWDVDDIDYPEGDDPNTPELEGTTGLFVVGIYSHANQTVQFQLPAGGDFGQAATDPNAVWNVAASPDATLTLAGRFGTLVMGSDGQYTYTPYADGESSALEALNYDNPGYEQFSYAIMDDSGAFSYSSITFKVNGANDAPEATNDVAEVVEFGAEHFAALGGAALTDQSEIDAVSTVIGNVLANDEDVDDADLVNEPTETPGVFVADAYTKNTDGSVKETFDVYNDTEDSDGTTAQQVVLQGLYGTLTIAADGSYTYVVDNDNPDVNVLNTDQSLTDTFYYTARNAYGDGVESAEASLDITINGTNDAPTDADFFVAGDLGAEGGIAIPFSRFNENITDPEDDHTGTDSSFRIESLPEGGTLYYDGNEVQIGEIYDLDDPIGQFTYVADPDVHNGVLLGSREAADADLSTWGDAVNNSTRQMTVDLDGDGNDDVTITTSISSGSLKVFDNQANHIGHGLANPSRNGIDMGETLSVDFNGAAVAYAEIGFDGLGDYFNPDSQQDAFATWVAYNGSEVVAWGTVNNDEMSYSLDPAVPTTHEGWLNATLQSADYDGVSGNRGDLFQSFVLNQDILNGATFDRLEFGTTEDGARDWNANWELRYVDVEFAGDHTFTYTAMDADGQTDTGIYDGPATVTILPGTAINEAPEAEPDLLVTNEDAAPSYGSVALNDTDFDDTTSELTFVLNEPAPVGLTFNADGTYEFDPSSYQYLPKGDQVEFELDYTVYDNGVPVENASSTLTITVLGLNDPPTLDLASDDAQITFVSQNAGYVNMLGVYHMVNGVPTEPEIIIEDSKDVQSGEVLATYAEDDNFGFFLIPNGGNANLPDGDMEFVQNPDSSWALSIGGQTVDIQFDYAGFNPAGEEPTFLVQSQSDGTWRVMTDDQLSGSDDDDFNDLIVEVDPGVSGLGYADVYTENDPPIAMTGNVDIDDIDNGAFISKATVTYMPMDDNDVITVPAGWTVTSTTDPGTGMVTLTITPEAGIGTYESLLGGMTFANTSEDPVGGDRVFTFVVTDDQGAESNPATSTITVVPVNDGPVAVDDTGNAAGNQPSDGGTGDGAFVLIAQELGDGGWVGAQVSEWGSGGGTHHGVWASDDENGNDRQIENEGPAERLLIQFNDGQSSVDLTITSQGGGQGMAEAWDMNGDPIPAADLQQSLHGNVLTVTSTGAAIGTVILMADGAKGSVNLKDVDSTPAGPGTVDPVIVEGNVLANDWDPDDADYPETGPFPGGNTDLTVTGISVGNHDNLTDAEYDQLLATGGFDPDSGTLSLTDDGQGATIAGTNGTLVIDAEGHYTYTPNPGATGEITDIFTYQIADPDGAVDYGLINISITANEAPVAAHDGEQIFVDTDAGTSAYLLTEQFSGSPESVHLTDASSGLGATLSGFTGRIEDGPDAWDAASLGQEGRNAVTGGTGSDFYATGVAVGDQEIDGDTGVRGETEVLLVTLDSAAKSVTLTLEALFWNKGEHEGAFAQAYDESGNALGDPVYIRGTSIGRPSVTLDAFEYNGAIAKVALFTDGGNKSDFLLRGVDYEVADLSQLNPVDGNVLANDYDPEAGDLDVTALASVDTDGSVLGHAMRVEGDLIIEGQHGTLTIDMETGEYRYEPGFSALGLNESATDSFRYTVEDGSGNTDEAFLEFSIHVDANDMTSPVLEISGGTSATLTGTDGNDVVPGYNNSTIITGEGHDAIVIDPQYLSDTGDNTVNIDDFSDHDGLDLGNLIGASVEITSTAHDVSLVFTDIDGSDDIVVNLMGVNPANVGVDETHEITTSEELNQVIQGIIDSGNDNIL